MTISICMIVKNEEEVIGRCLESIKGVADEIIVVDTGSTDLTKQIADEYTDKIYDFEWVEDFSAARNYSFSKAKMEYCMWLDADDVLAEKDRTALIDLKKTLAPNTDIVMMKYNTTFDEMGNPTFSYFRERIVKNNGKFFWTGKVHEVIEMSGNIMHSEIAVSHKKIHVQESDRNLRIYEKQLTNEEVLSPRDMFYFSRELYYHYQYERAAKFFQEFLDSQKGWIENNIEACRFMALCLYKLDRCDDALEALLKSLQYDIPRAEVCCDIGRHFFDRNIYNVAIFWYKTALSSERNDKSGAFVMTECYGYIPAIQLCVCYDHIGDKEAAKHYNEIAGKYNPLSTAYLKNKEYFESLNT